MEAAAHSNSSTLVWISSLGSQEATNSVGGGTLAEAPKLAGTGEILVIADT